MNNIPFNLPIIGDRSQSEIPSAYDEHKHSGAEAIASGAANACPICQAFEIKKLTRERDTLQQIVNKLIYRDGQLMVLLQKVRDILQKWMEGADHEIKAAADYAIRDALIKRLVTTVAIDNAIETVMERLIPGGENAKQEGSGKTQAADSGS
jgi:hypothetical protein